KAFDLYTLFWGLNLNSIDESAVKEIIEKTDEKTAENIKNDKEDICLIQPSKDPKTTFDKLKNFVSKAIDCCKE
ncbi:MAG: hypothetical protein LBH46_04555, partial [Rickettsiales bacterium]|nr:hypothetical protein [Rickettsiales bacterium]